MTCSCGCPRYKLVGFLDPSTMTMGTGTVSLDAEGYIVAWSGIFECADCGERAQPPAPARLRAV